MRSELPAGWKAGTLSDLVRLQRGHDLPEPTRRPGPVPVMGSAGVSGFHDEARVRGPGVVIGRSGASFGKVHYCRQDYWPLNTALFATDFRGNDPRFVYFLLRATPFEAFNSGSAQQSLNRNFIAAIPIGIPPRDEQVRIARLLAGLDDKIGSNRRMARALGEVALTATAHAASRADDVITVSDLGVQIKEPGGVDRPYVGLDVMPQGSTVLDDWTLDNAPNGASWSFEPGDLLYGKLRPYFRKVVVAPIAGRCTREIVVLRPREEHYYGLLVGTVASQQFIDFCTAVSSGTKMPRAEWSEAGRFEVGLPARAELDELTEMARANYRAVAGLVRESRALESIRDALLPKLVSGQLRIPISNDAEETLGGATGVREAERA